jgi:hypothetical protein
MRTTIRTLASLVGIAVIATALPAQAATAIAFLKKGSENHLRAFKR